MATLKANMCPSKLILLNHRLITKKEVIEACGKREVDSNEDLNDHPCCQANKTCCGKIFNFKESPFENTIMQ